MLCLAGFEPFVEYGDTEFTNECNVVLVCHGLGCSFCAAACFRWPDSQHHQLGQHY